MPLKPRYLNVKDKFKRTFGMSSANTSSASIDRTQLTRSPDPVPPPPELYSTDDIVVKDTGAGRSQDTRAVWPGVRTLLRVLESSSDVCPPLKSVVGGLNRVIDIFESASKGREDYLELGLMLKSLIEDLSKYAGNIGNTMTASTRNLSIALDKELRMVQEKYARTTQKRLAEGLGDHDDILACYHRVHGYLERLLLNLNLDTSERVNRLNVETYLQRLSPALSAVYNSSDSEDAQRRACTPGTRERELIKLLSWARGKSAMTKDVYWLNGMAGTGKTTIAYSLCVELEQSAELGASFFCSRSIPECRNVKSIVPSIAYQLARFSHPFRFALLEILEENPDVHSLALSSQFNNLLVRPLEKVKNTLPTDLVVVIDALDECEKEDSIERILDLLISTVTGSDLPVRFLISSRPDLGIYNRMMGHPVGNSLDSRLVLHDLDAQLVNQDIEKYLWSELEGIGLTASQFAALVKLSGALFIFASTAAKYIKQGLQYMQHEDRLNAILGLSSAPTDNRNKEIDNLYTTILQGVFDDERLDLSIRGRLKKMLDMIVCVQEPMSVIRLADLLGETSSEHVGVLLRRLGSVLNVADSTGPVSTLHASFSDYMLDPQRSSPFHCNYAMTHALIARTCFETIQMLEPQLNLCKLRSSYFRDDELVSRSIPPDAAVSPQLFYACCYWMKHLELGSEIGEWINVIWDFFSMRLLLWMEVLNLKKCIHLAPEIMLHAESWSRKREFSYPIIEFTHDAWRFATMFAGHAVSQSTAHIYVSMLPFWPANTPISQKYYARMRGAVQAHGTAMARRQLSLLATWTFDSLVQSACFSPDGSLIAFGVGSLAHIIDAITGKPIICPLSHNMKVRSVTFSPDGTLLASGSDDNTIRVWSTYNGKLVMGPLTGHSNFIVSVCFFPDGTRIASGADTTIRVWSITEGATVVGPINAHDHWITTMCVAPSGTLIASGSQDNSIRVWDAESGQMILGPLEGHTDMIRSLCFSPDGASIVSGSDDKAVRLWSTVDSRACVGIFRGHTDNVYCVTFSPDGRCIASGSSDTTLRVWSVEETSPLTVLRGHTNTVVSVVFSSDGTRIASSSYDKTIRIWDAQSRGPTVDSLHGHTHGVSSVMFSHQGDYILSSSYDSTACIWDAHNGRLVDEPLRGHASWVHSVCLSPDSTQIATGSEDKTVQLWNMNARTPSGESLVGHSKGVVSVCFSPSGDLIASGSQDGTIQLWDARSRDPIISPLAAHKTWVCSVCFSPDGQRLYTGSGDRTVQVWDVMSMERLLSPLKGHTAGVLSVCTAPNGSRIASGSIDKTIRIWDANRGTAIRVLRGHDESVTSVCFSPDSLCIVSASDDRSICLWDAQSGHMVTSPLMGHTAWVRSCSFSPDGRWLVSGSDDRTIRVWKLFGPGGIWVSEGARTQTVSAYRESSPAPYSWALQDDGWVIDSQSRLLVWVPPDLRGALLHPRNAFLISTGGSFQLDFEFARLGDSWETCYVPP